jgi:hypothetical protein
MYLQNSPALGSAKMKVSILLYEGQAKTFCGQGDEYYLRIVAPTRIYIKFI